MSGQSTTSTSAPTSSNHTGAIVGGVIGGITAVALVASLFFFWKNHSATNLQPDAPGANPPDTHLGKTASDVEKATVPIPASSPPGSDHKTIDILATAIPVGTLLGLSGGLIIGRRAKKCRPCREAKHRVFFHLYCLMR